MPKFLVTWLLTALALILTAFLVPGINLDSFTAAIIAAAVLGFANAIVQPILFVLTLPLTIITLGLFLPLLNVITLSLVSGWTPGFEITNFLSAVLGAIVLAMVSGVLNGLVDAEEEA